MRRGNPWLAHSGAARQRSPPHQPTIQACPTHICKVTKQLQPCKFRVAQPSRVDMQEQTTSWTQTCGPTTCNEATGGCPHTPVRPRTTGPTACKEAAGGCPHRKPRQPDLQLAMKPWVAAHTAKPNTTGPTTCKKAARGCPHARKSELQVPTYN